MWRSAGLLAAGLGLITLGVWWTKAGSSRTQGAPPLEASAALPSASSLIAPATDQGSISAQAGVTPWPARVLHDPVVIGPCPIAPVAEQDISSQVEGVLHELVVSLGQQVRQGQVLAKLDDHLLCPQVELLEIKAASDAARLIAKGQYEEADANLTMARKLSAKSAMPPVEFRSYVYQRDRHAEELRKAEEDQEVARKELAKARRTLELYEIKSRIDGEVTRLYRRSGETIKDTEPLVCVTNFDRLRVDGLCKVQHANLFRVGMRALVEPELRGEQLTELGGHTAALTGIAVAADGRLVASASEDRTVLVWQWPQATRVASLRHPAEVFAVAIAPRTQAGAGSPYVLLTGGADSRARLWSITSGGTVAGPTVLPEGHEGAIRAVAFSSDGKQCATAGEDRKIALWDVASGKRLYWVQMAEAGQEGAHHGAVTAVHFTPDAHLVSAGRDNVLKVWKLEEHGAVLVTEHQGRTGDVAAAGISPDGRRVLFDHGEELRILDRGSGAVLGSLRSQRQGRFTAFATFAPTGTAVLTVANNGRLQVWNVPADPDQARFFRQAYADGFRRDSLAPLQALGSTLTPAGLVPAWATPLVLGKSQASPLPGKEGYLLPQLWSLDGFESRYYLGPNPAAVTCGAFAPDGTVLFTGGADRVIRVWSAPAATVWQQPLEAEITYVGSQVERGTDTVRIRAELKNPRDPARRLRPGTYANLRLYPETVAGP